MNTETNTLTAPEAAPRRARTGEARNRRRMAKLADTALNALEEVLTDGCVKPADRLNAAKLAFDIIRQNAPCPEQEDTGPIRVVIEGMPQEYAE